MNDRTLGTLEFPKILDQLQEYASFSAGKEAIEGLRPSTDLQTVEALIRQTTEARVLLEARPSTHLGGAHDVREAVQRAAVGSVLTPRELLEIGDTLGAAGRVRSAVLKDDLDLPWLRSRAQRLAENRPLMEALAQTLSDRGEILDSASPALRRLRLEIQTAQGRLMDRLNSMVSSTENRSLLQEPIVTMRNGRYVIPVRSDSRSKVPGIVHDQSASGQTVFVEPLVVTELNNRLKELQLEEEREIERILRELSDRVASQAPELRATVEALVDIDVAFAKAKYASALRATAPKLNDQGRTNLVQARHPLLRGEVVPISIWLGNDFRVLIITGPNTGGKTVALKTIGLLTQMAQAGLHVPAESASEIAVYPKIFADIGDEQSIEQSLSTFSSHMRNIISMLPDIDARSLVLLDELGAGTDPAEGAALARALLTSLLESGARAVVTTHYSELKTFALEEDGVENASVEFDVERLTPTYRLIIGLPGRSQALAIAKRLGMPQRVLAIARQNVSAGAVRVETLLAQIQNERREIGQLYDRARELHGDARKLRDRLQSELRSVKREREDILVQARAEAAGIVRDLRAQLRSIEDTAGGSASRREQRELRARVDEVQSATAEALGSRDSASDSHEPQIQPLQAGATVQILSLQQQGTVLSTRDGEAEVQFGQFTVRVPTDDLQVLSRKQREPERRVEVQVSSPAPPMELDVRGWRADDAVREVDQYLHDNYMHGQGTVRIVHGKGTGALRKAIREQLDSNPLVQSHATEKRELGGDGVTVVKLAV
jgi:DNA mismatch repair protein MutS2